MGRKKKSKKKPSGGKQQRSSGGKSKSSLYGDETQNSWAALVIVGVLVLVSAVVLGKYDFSEQLNSLWGSGPAASPKPEAKSKDQGPAVDFRELEPLQPMPAPQQLINYCDKNGKNCVDMYPWNIPKNKRSPLDKACEDVKPDHCKGNPRKRCQSNPGWMIVFCPKFCNACRLKDPKRRCTRKAYPSLQQPALTQPGDVAKRYENIVERWSQYEPVVMKDGDPYHVVFQNLLSDKESDTLVRWLEKLNPKRSTTQTNEWDEKAGVMKQAHNQARTSENAWCTGGCWRDPVIRRVTNRIARITDTPIANFESYQLVRYTKGQYYRTHSDCNSGDRQSTQTAGHRIFTFFIYLSDVEEGGHTFWPRLDVKVKPKKGAAAFWPDVQNVDPTRCDKRFDHHAMDVIKGTKYGANIWIHNFDYTTASHWGCTGSFT